jgi:hypothetical protein
MLILVFFPVSIFMGVLSAVILDLLDPHIYTAPMSKASWDSPPSACCSTTVKSPRSSSTNAPCASLPASIMQPAVPVRAHFVLTGVNSGAGTTSIIENLGSMLAKLGRKTLVIDPSGNSEPVAFMTLGADLQRRPVNFSGWSGANAFHHRIAKDQACAFVPAGQGRTNEWHRL